MTQNLLPAPRAGCGWAPGARCLLQWGYLGFRFARYQCSPWFGLAIAVFRLPFAPEVERMALRIRYLRAIARIDFVGVYGLLNDLLW